MFLGVKLIIFMEGKNMKNQIKKVVGVMMLVVVLFTSVGQEAQAAKQIKWPYGDYVATGKNVRNLYGIKKLYLTWGFYTEPTIKYPELIRIYTNKENFDNDNTDACEEWTFRKIGTNKYRTKGICGPNHYLKLTVYKNKLTIREVGIGAGKYLFREGPYNFTFKLKKRLSKNVG